jgi:hypothetical protein
MLSVRIDYRHTGKDPQHELTAANMVIRDAFPSIVEGVEIERVEAYNHGEQVLNFIK